ncbi:Fc receptor-like B [Channa argus]|uniref:Fc receptor-like B n=1 Tax=Channa argus TaxID=215402 RepID=UPI003521A499
MFSHHPDNMKSPPVSLLLGVSVLLLLPALAASAVSLNISPSRQQFFSGESVSLSCVEDGQRVDGWTVKRTRGGQTEELVCRTGSSCDKNFISKPGVYWCEDRAGQRSVEVNITVTDGPLILQIPALPVMTGSDVTLHCKKKTVNRAAAYFFINGSRLGNETKPNHTITNVQQSDEGLYSCATKEFGSSPESWLRVRGQGADVILTTHTSTPTSPPPLPSHVTPLIAVRCSLILLVPVLVGLAGWCSCGRNKQRKVSHRL